MTCDLNNINRQTAYNESLLRGYLNKGKNQWTVNNELTDDKDKNKNAVRYKVTVTMQKIFKTTLGPPFTTVVKKAFISSRILYII